MTKTRQRRGARGGKLAPGGCQDGSETHVLEIQKEFLNSKEGSCVIHQHLRVSWGSLKMKPPSRVGAWVVLELASTSVGCVSCPSEGSICPLFPPDAARGGEIKYLLYIFHSGASSEATTCGPSLQRGLSTVQSSTSRGTRGCFLVGDLQEPPNPLPCPPGEAMRALLFPFLLLKRRRSCCGNSSW